MASYRKKTRNNTKVAENLFQNATFLTNSNKTSIYEKISIGFVLLVFSFYLCFMYGNTYYTDTTHIRWVLMLVLTSIYVASLGFMCFINAEYRNVPGFFKGISKEKLFNKFSLSQMILVVYLIVALISAIAAQRFDWGSSVWVGTASASGRFEGFITILTYCSIFLLLSQFGKFNKNYVYVLAGAMIIFSFVGIYQYFGVNILHLYPRGYDYSNTKFLSSTSNIDCASGLIAITLPILFASYVLYDGKYRYYLILPAYIISLFVQLLIDVDSGKLGLIAALMFALPMLWTCSKRILRILELLEASTLIWLFRLMFKVKMKSGVTTVTWSLSNKYIKLLLVLAIVILLVWAYYFIKDRTFKNATLNKLHEKLAKVQITPKQYRIVICCLLGVAIIAALIFLYTYNGSVKTIKDISQFLHGNLPDSAGNNRGFVWKNSVKLIKDYWLVGAGPDMFKNAFAPYNEIWGSLHPGRFFDYAHCDFLQIVINLGVPALLLYLGFLVSLFVRGIKKIDNNPLLIPFGLSIIAYVIHSGFSFSVAIITMIYWVVLGLFDYQIRHTSIDVEKENK